ncbi:DUF1080 domain-containing protein [Dysgonomonadaceae bacterium zrk40]|nr:DUF1080 domain-containing protein [Dysgonomonadaceae bacterium zrk40]
MKKNTFFVMILSALLLTACNGSQPSGDLLGENAATLWELQGDATISDKTLTLNEGAAALLKKGRYDNFELSLTLRLTETGKGFLAFHSDEAMTKGYRVALNNDLTDEEWWTKTGSLLGVRNLTKSVVKSNEWFNMILRVEGNAITILLNGTPVVEYIEPAAPYRTEEHASQLLSKGTFALKSNAGTIEVSAISLALLPEATDLSTQLAEAIDETDDQIIRLHQENFPVLDYHVHLKGISADEAAAQSRRYGINYALAPNCGIGFPITSDEEVLQYLKEMEGQPFIQAMQGEGREWPETFSEEVRERFDYVFTDALTFTDRKGRRTRLWIPEEVFIEDEEEYMDLIVEKIVAVMQEPMDVYVNPNFLPEVMNDRYDAFWTEERMDRVITAMKGTGKALEINHRYRIPYQAFIQKAKNAGLKFTFGTNNADGNFGKMEYCIEMKEACGITAADMYKPNIQE